VGRRGIERIAGGYVSEIIKDHAVILRVYDFGESSTIVVALTRKHGKIRLLAKGAKKQRSPFLGNLQTGSIGEIVFYFRASRGLQLLKEVTAGYVFDSAGGDLERLCLFQAGLELVDRSIIELDTDSGAYDTLRGFIEHVQIAADPWVAFFALEVRFAGILGHLPHFGMCEVCKKRLVESEMRVNPSSGAVTCEDCHGEGALHVSRRSAALLVRMCSVGFDDLVSERAPAKVRREVGRLLHGIFLHHVDGYRLPKSLHLIGGD
jgi:DNA repair protein RecO (recombination protein O)